MVTFSVISQLCCLIWNTMLGFHFVYRFSSLSCHRRISYEDSAFPLLPPYFSRVTTLPYIPFCNFTSYRSGVRNLHDEAKLEMDFYLLKCLLCVPGNRSHTHFVYSRKHETWTSLSQVRRTWRLVKWISFVLRSTRGGRPEGFLASKKTHTHSYIPG